MGPKVDLIVKLEVEDHNSIFIRCLSYLYPCFLYSLRLLVFEELGQLSGNSITDFCGLCLATNVASLDTLLDDNLDGLVDRLGEFGLLEGVLEHHTD